MSHCQECGGKGTPVSRKTVLLMLKPEMLERALVGRYRFCSERNCEIVYFQNDGDYRFKISDLRIRVGLKVKDDPIPLCYCFGFDEDHIRYEIARTGNTVPETIRHLIREGFCACETRNPSGSCCLGEVNKAARNLKQRAVPACQARGNSS